MATQTYFTLGEASKETGISKPTLSKALKSGKLSYVEKTTAGYKIEASELFRVYPKKPQETEKAERLATPKETLDNMVLQVELEAVRRELATANLERDRERQQLSEQIEHLRGALDKEQATTAMLTDQRNTDTPTDGQKERSGGLFRFFGGKG